MASDLNGTTSLPAIGLTGGTLQFAAPLVPGTYNLRFFVNGGQSPIATSSVVTVQTETPASLTMVTPAVEPGEHD